MVFRRRMKRKARKPRRKATRRMVRSVPRNNFLSTKRFVIQTTLNGSDTTPSGTGAETFAFDRVPAYTEFTNSFDAYRLAGIRYRWVVYRSADMTGTTLGGTTGIYTRVMFAYDFNDASSPGSFAELQQYNTVKEIYLTNSRPVSKWYFFKPKDLTLAAGGYHQPRRSNWLRMNETNVAHYGLKWVYDGNQQSQQIRLEAYYYFQLKSVK